MNIFELRKTKKSAMARADAILSAAENAGRNLTASESSDVDAQMAVVTALNPQIDAIERKNTLAGMFPSGIIIPGGPTEGGRGFEPPQQKIFGADYAPAFYKMISSSGREIGAALYEGSNSAGGYAVPVVVDNQIVPLAPQEMAVRQLATVLPTVSDIKFPVKASFGSAAIKTETNAFGGSPLTLGQFTLSAFMVGAQNDISWELAQDVPAFQATEINDMILAQQMLEESYYITGSGSGQPQGLIGNCGAGGTYEADTNGNLVTINGTLDLTGQLNAVYHKNASWLMARPTSIILRKAQVEANLYNPAWSRVGTQDFLHGYPVFYATDMPAVALGNTPILFGDFKQGYLIGDRGGSGINVKVLDQPKATSGLITLLTYRRTDGRVRRSEAVQSYNVAAS